MLDEECLRPGEVSDKTFLDKLVRSYGQHDHFECRSTEKSRSDKTLPTDAFRLIHYAGKVNISNGDDDGVGDDDDDGGGGDDDHGGGDYLHESDSINPGDLQGGWLLGQEQRPSVQGSVEGHVLKFKQEPQDPLCRWFVDNSPNRPLLLNNSC